MRMLGNVLWLVLAGWWLALGYFLAGVLACLLVVTIPCGIASFRLAGYALWPFGRTIVRDPYAGVASLLGNVVWVVLFGWWLAVGHLVAGVALCLTVIGIPFGVASVKLAVAAVAPLGARIVPIALPPARYRTPAYR